MIQIEQLDFSYPKSGFRLRIPDVCVARGETVALIGPSGSGKTTLLNLMAGILQPGKGRVCLRDTALGTLSDAARRRFRIGHIGFVFQDFGLIEYLHALDNVLLPCLIHSDLELTSATRERARTLITQVGLAGKEKQPVRELSHGEKQRVAICRALLNQPSWLFADEPTGNLDPASAEEILNLLFGQAVQTGATLLTVTHNHDILDRFDRVIDVGQWVGGTEEASQRVGKEGASS